jgi:two-component system sensor histidine kinase/response regulator
MSEHVNEPVNEGELGGEILIVDDFIDTLALYEALLAEDGHRVRTAASGAEALRKVEEKEPELVLLDVSMPGMDGLEVLRRLRARRGGGPSVIMLTAARREPTAIESGLREGADAYLTKPIEGRELRARTRAALESFRLKRQLEAQRRDHVAMLVHDLRHPISSLALIAEVIDAEEQTPDERRVAMDTIRTLCADMARLVDGVLAASRLEAGLFTVDPKRITARELIRPSIASFSPVAARRRLEFTTEGDLDIFVRADPAKLRQAIDNLLANAIKFTPKGGKVRLRIASDPRGVVIEVADSGTGIAESERPTIFDRYRQGSRGRTAGGAGLGLAIARGIAEAHGGNISIVTGDLPGAVFRLFVPA